MSVRISGTGSALPERVVSNADLERMVETNDEWIVSRTGIRERRMMAPEEATSDLVTRAAERALEHGRARARGSRPDHRRDLHARHAHARDRELRAPQPVPRPVTIPAFDIYAACSGFVYGLEVATSMLKSARLRARAARRRRGPDALHGLRGAHGLHPVRRRARAPWCSSAARSRAACSPPRCAPTASTATLIQIPGGGARMPSRPTCSRSARRS